MVGTMCRFSVAHFFRPHHGLHATTSRRNALSQTIGLDISCTDRSVVTGSREYKSSSLVCKNCPLLDQCTRSCNQQKVTIRHVWEDDRERINQSRLGNWGRWVSERRREMVERSFTDAK